jgi:UDP-N-acetylmuramyl pentapeptide phosphotransferase/UDP-N-acetylglucosamine-1-phosphate transferase
VGAIVRPEHLSALAAVGVSSAMLMLIGFIDDRRSVPIMVRLCVQFTAVAIVVWAFWPLHPLKGILPQWAVIVIVPLFLIWFINLTNFMDGMDLMIASGFGIPFACIACLAILGAISPDVGIMAAAAAGGLAGFSRLNWPPARIILGDSGSLPIGLIAGLAIVRLLESTPEMFAILPFSFVFADSTSTLFYRAITRQPVLEGHSTHAYQLALKAGLTKRRVIAILAIWTLAISGLSAWAVLTETTTAKMAAVVVSLIGVVALIAYLRTRQTIAPWQIEEASQDRQAKVAASASNPTGD